MDAMERWPKALVGDDAPGAICLLRDVEGAHSDGEEEHKSAAKKWEKKGGEEDDDESSGFTLPARFEIRSLFDSTNQVFSFLLPSRM